MPSKLRYEIDVNESVESVDASLNLSTNGQEQGIVRLGDYLRESLIRGVSVNVVTGLVQATGTFTFSGLPLDAETLTINGVTFTARTSGATVDEFNIGADATETASNMVSSVNSTLTIGIVAVVTASSVAGVVTITADLAGILGNFILIAESMTNVVTSGMSLSGGQQGVPILLSSGI